MSANLVDSVLNRLNRKGTRGLLAAICYLGYKVKGKDIKSVKYLEDLGAWEFKVGNDYFFSSGPGWAYSYDFLMKQFIETPGFNYVPAKGDCVVDVGAGVGEELMVFSRLVGETGKVFAIEAHPKTFQVLKGNCEKNKIKNAILLNVAVADVPGQIFIEGAENALGNKVNANKSPESVSVEAITIEQLVERHNIPRINFLKVNIEGAEQLLIKGIGKAISRIDHMAISCHDFRYLQEGDEFFKTMDIVQKFLTDNNFEYLLRDANSAIADSYVFAFPRKGR